MQGFHPQKNKAAQVKNYAQGGIVRGPGTGTSDDVPATVPPGSYVMPADSTRALGFKAGVWQKGPRGDGLALGFKPRARDAMFSKEELVLAPDQVQAAGGVEVLDAFRSATHSQVPDQNIPGKPKTFFANGGLVGDVRKNSFGDSAAASANPSVTQVPTRSPNTPAPAARPAFTGTPSDIPNSAPAGWKGGTGTPVTGDDFTRNVSNTMSALGPIGGGLTPVVSGLARMGAAAAKAASASPLVDKALSYGIPAAGFGALASASSQDTQQVSQTTAARTPSVPVAAQPGTGRGFAAPGASARPSSLPMQPDGQPASQSLGFAPGVYQHGRGQYSDNAAGMGFAPGFTGKPGAQNMAAADALAAQSQGAGLGFAPGSAGALANSQQGPGQAAPQSFGQSGGFGLLDNNARALRSASMDAQQLKPGAGRALAGVIQQQADAPKLQIERDKAAADTASASADRALKADEINSARGFRAGQLANDSARTALDARKTDSDLQARGFEVSQAKRLENIRQKYETATDPKVKGELAQQLRTLSGKDEQQARFTVVPGGQEYDQAAGVMRNVPARVLNNQTGQFMDGRRG